MIDSSSGDTFGVLCLPVLECCSAVWCSAADTHLKILDRVVSGACFLDGGVLNCNLSHRRSVAMLCMLYKIRGAYYWSHSFAKQHIDDWILHCL